jgi:predicted alpha/beta superfamily hydrolase
MKYLLLLCCITQLAQAQQKDSIYSEVLKEKRPLIIFNPGDDTTTFKRPAYPVIYVLDGYAHFETLRTMIQELAVNEGNTVFPQMLIVGILNTPGNRNKNLADGREDFTTFLEKELFPYIEKNYATAPYRILIGHSLGGLFASNTLLHHKELFNAYIATDPSIFFNNSEILKDAPKLLRQDLQQRKYYVAIAGPMNSDFGREFTRISHEWVKLLEADKNNHLRWSFKDYPDDDHHSVPFIGIYDGLRYIFPHYRFPTYLYTDDSPADSVRALVIAHYNTLSQEMGYKVRPPEWFLNQMGYWNLMDKRYNKAAMSFQLNIDYYPDSFNTYDSMGDYYLAVNDTSNAGQSWKKALSLRNNEETRQKLYKISH